MFTGVAYIILMQQQNILELQHRRCSQY